MRSFRFFGLGLLLVAACGGSVETNLPEDAATDAAAPDADVVKVPPIAFGHLFACGIKPNGSVACWGRNEAGQLGNGAADPDAGSMPATPAPTVVAGLDGVSAIAAGERHACAVRSGVVWCWGSNDSGQLGDPNLPLDENHVPNSVPGITNAVSLAAGAGFTCAQLTTGTVKCWGSCGEKGCFGGGNAVTENTTLTDVKAITGIGVAPCALTNGGAVWCWGQDTFGQLGDGPPLADATTPVPVKGLSSGVVAVGTGTFFACALLVEGTVRCWGAGVFGELGDGKETNSDVPVPVVGIQDAIALSVGAQHACVLKKDRTAMCWGNNVGASIGTGSSSPVSVSTPTAVKVVTTPLAGVLAGETQTCAVTTTGVLRCWGSGMLGDGKTSGSPTPVNVDGF